MGDSRSIVLYDRDCGFCRWTLAKLLAWDRRGRVRPVAIQDPEGRRLLAGMSEEERMGSWHLAEPGAGAPGQAGGTVLSAGAAFEPLFGELPGGRPLAALARRFPDATERAYRAVAGRRTMFGRRISAGAKRRADRRIAARGPLGPGPEAPGRP